MEQQDHDHHEEELRRCADYEQRHDAPNAYVPLGAH
jgi:hypothetical protein